ncbi:MAG: glycosyltransferase [Pseudonocardiales bacterium]|nr:MAG: glycosyltransferase [Pseudonocardiales bacterium]
MNTIVVIAKAPVPGRVKTRLSPALSPQSAAQVAAAALADTLDAVRGVAAARRVLALAGALTALPPGFEVVAQRGDGLGARLATAFADAGPGPVLLVGMDTPQLTAAVLGRALLRLAYSPAVIGPATDGGWWALGLRDVRHAAVLSSVPMSRPDTAELTVAALQQRGVPVAPLPVLRDVDTIADAVSVAAAAPGTRFARTLAGVLALETETA